MFSTAAKTCLRAKMTKSTPATRTAVDTRSGAVTPCHRARWEWYSSPVIAVTAAEIGPSTCVSSSGTTKDIKPGSAAGSQRRTGASWTWDMSFGPSTNAPKTIFAE